jgi:dolichyl-phosphate-mannose--protein O-mannosyl transferase
MPDRDSHIPQQLLKPPEFTAFITTQKVSQLMGEDLSEPTSIFQVCFPTQSTKPLTLNGIDVIAVIFFLSLGIITRLFRIQYPPYLVFDEVYFGNFTNWYLHGSYFMDIHPPLAKLIMAGVARSSGYAGDINFESLGEETPYPHIGYVWLRVTPAFFGALCIPLTYLAMRAMLSTHFASATAALLLTADGMLITEARHILSDGILHFFACLAIWSIFLSERIPSLLILVLEGFCLGCVAACKYTSGGIILLALLRQFPLKVFKKWKFLKAAIFRVCLLTSIVVLIHFICFVIHLQLLPYIPLDPVIAPASVEAGLISRSNPNWTSRSNAPSLIRRVIDLVWYMHCINMEVEVGHPYESKWFEWPLATGKWVLYWTRDGKHIICMGNILLWWPVFGAVIANTMRAVITKDFESPATAMVIGWVLSYLPFALVPREMFVYHYAIPLIFGCCNLAAFIEEWKAANVRGFGYCTVITMAGIGFLLWCPWSYGLTTPDFEFLVWINRWRW